MSAETHAKLTIPDLAGKAVLITGASTGIGAALARAFVINNAGLMLGRVASLEADDAHVEAVIALNVKSVIAVTRAARPWLARQGGFVVNTTSIAARNGGGGGAVLYAAAKGFVSTITKGHAKELIGDKIRVNGVAPGVIATPFHDRYSDDQTMEAMRRTVPMGRVGTPEDCVGAYLFLASELLSGYVIGQIIEVNGGQLMP
jgi:3-oxoacyl-[acyl-carrier protein] reductase